MDLKGDFASLGGYRWMFMGNMDKRIDWEKLVFG